MTEPAMQISVGVNLESVDRDLKEVTKKVDATPKKIGIEVKTTGIDNAIQKFDRLTRGHLQQNAQLQQFDRLLSRAEEMVMREALAYAEMAEQVEKCNKAMGQQVALMSQSIAVNDNHAGSIGTSGLEMASLANHAKQATIALYALSPAFRAAVNPAITAAAERSSQALIAMGPAAASASLAIVRGLSPIAAAASRVLLAVSMMKTGLDLTTEAWDLGGKKLDEYRSIAERAATIDLSTSYFQKITKAAEQAKLPVDTLTQALQNLRTATTEQLSGSTLDKRLNEHLKVGNFAGNSGVDAIAMANTTEERFKAVVKLIDEAMGKGQRLAALDIANTTFGPDITDRLRQDSEYLHNLQASAERISATQLVSDADVGRALELQRRYDAAAAILAERWHPIQGALTELGIRMQTAWVGIVEGIANAVDWVAKLVAKIAEIPVAFWSFIAKGAGAALPFAGSLAGAPFGPLGTMAGWAVGKGVAALGGGGAKDEDQLAAAMRNANTVRAAGTLGLKIYDNVIKDTSRSLGEHAAQQQQAANAYDRAEASVAKHIARMEADRQAIGLGVGGLEELRTAALLNTAAMQAGLPKTQALADKIQDLAQDAGDAAQKLAEQQAISRALFDLQTAGLSGVELQIAQLNYRLHGDNWKQFGDAGVAGMMRFAAALPAAKEKDNDNRPADEERKAA